MSENYEAILRSVLYRHARDGCEQCQRLLDELFEKRLSQNPRDVNPNSVMEASGDR